MGQIRSSIRLIQQVYFLSARFAHYWTPVSAWSHVISVASPGSLHRTPRNREKILRMRLKYD